MSKNPKATPAPLIELIPIDRLYEYYIIWKTRPITETGIKSIQEFCEKYNTNTETLIEFQKKATYIEDIDKATIEWFRKQTPQVLHILIDKIKQDKMTTDIQRFAEIYKILTQKEKDSGGNTFNFINLSADKFKNIALREAKAINENK
jgi:hypothetical protein